jgi:hypothetical protein
MVLFSLIVNAANSIGGSIAMYTQTILAIKVTKQSMRMYAILLTCLSYLIPLAAAELQPYDAIINLGGDCQPAYQMNRNGIRYYALPFDTLITPFAALQKLLENKFDQFLKPEQLELRGTENDKYILDTYYDVRLLHDFPKEEGFMQEYERIKTTYDRRTARFLTLIAQSKKPLFIRKKITRAEASILVSLLSTLCGHSNFTLLALDGSEEAKENWGIDNVENRHLRQPLPYVWRGDDAAWEEIFSSVGLILMPLLVLSHTLNR